MKFGYKWHERISRRFVLTESSKSPVKQALAVLIFAALLAPALALILTTTQVEVVVASPDVTKTENLWVDSFDYNVVEWEIDPPAPNIKYLDAISYPDNYVNASYTGLEIGNFGFSDLSVSGTINSVILNLYIKYATDNEIIRAWVSDDDGTTWVASYDFCPTTSFAWHSADVTSVLNTSTKVNDAKIYLEGIKVAAWKGALYADAAYLSVNYTLPPPEKPVLLDPDNGITTADTMPTFYWTAGAYAENHRIEIDDDSDFSSVTENDNVVGTNWTPDTGLSVGTYYWRVWAINAAGENMSEDTWEFTITTWWDTNWTNRRKIEISPLNPENYQIKIFFDNLGGMKSDLSDLRFLENVVTSETLPHWVENYTVDNATVWVRRLENADNSIYVYYSNPNASSIDNYDNTMTKDFGESGLVLLFHMDEGAGTSTSDSSGNSNTGYLENQVTWVGSDGGQWDNRDITFLENDHLDFAGVDDWIRVESSASLDIDESISVEVWAKFDNTTNVCIVTKRNVEEGFELRVDAANKPHFLTSATAYGTGVGTATSPNAITTGEWYHIVGTLDDDNNQLSIYVDGVLENYEIHWEATRPDPLESPLTTLYIGIATNLSQDLNGQLDELRIYNRALSADEIKCHYERRKFVSPEPVTTVGAQEPPPVLPTKPVLYSPANGITITDETPYFEWTLGSNADYHRLQVSSDNTFTSVVQDENLYDNNYTIADENWLSDGEYWWKVSAKSENGENASLTWSFTMNAISVFEASSGVDEIWRYKDSSGELFRVAMSEDGEYIAIGGYGGYLRYFNVDENVPKWSKSYSGADVQNVAVSDNGQYIVASVGSTLYFYDNAGTELWTAAFGATVAKDTVDISGDARYVTAGQLTSGDTTASNIKLYEGIEENGDPSGALVWTYQAGGRIRGTAISDNSADGKYRIVAVSHDQHIYFFDNDDSTVLWSYYWENADSSYYKICSVAISEDGNYIFAGAPDNMVYLFDNNDNEYLWRYEFTDNTYFIDQHVWHIVDISDDGQYMIGGIDVVEGGTLLWSKDENIPIWWFRGMELRDVKVSGDGNRMIGAGWDGVFYSWTPEDNIPVWYFGDIAERPDDTAVSEDGSLVAGIGFDTLYLLQDGSFAYGLLTEGQKRSHRILTTTPEFSFKLPSRKVENIVAFRIVVGENISDVENLMWNPSSIDVDFENEENEVYHTYAGRVLSPYIPYDWRVRLKDNENNWSPWSVTRSFEIVELLDFDNYCTITFTGDIPDNYQVKVSIDNATTMDENFKDLLFYDGGSVGLAYWIENYNIGENATVWVKVHDNGNIRMCYNNDSVEDASYGDDVFIHFDNFDGTSVDYRKWTTNGTPVVSDGWVTLTGTVNERLMTKIQHGTDLSLRTRANIGDSSDNLYISFSKGDIFAGLGDQIPGALFWGTGSNLYLRTGAIAWHGGGIGTDNNAHVSYLGQDTVYELKRIGTDNVELWANDDNLVLANLTNIGSAPVPIYLYNSGTSGTLKVDWVFLRKCLGVEPTVTVGGEETWGWEEIESWSGSLQNPAPPSVENLHITDMDNVATDNLNPQVQYKFWVEVADNETLADIENVTLVVYLDNENLADNSATHYTFKWTRDGGFEEVGPGGVAAILQWEHTGETEISQGYPVGDPDNDGKNELMFENAYGLEIWEWNGSTYVYDHGITLTNLSGYISGNVDNDPEEEVILVNDNVYVFEWNGSTFVQAFTYNPGGNIYDVNIGEADNNETPWPEIILSIDPSATDNNIEVLTYDSGTDNYVIKGYYRAGSSTTAMAEAGDVDNDGENEIVFAYGTEFYVIQWNGSAYENIFDDQPLAGRPVYGVAIGDVDSNGVDEILLGSSLFGSTTTIWLYGWNGSTFVKNDTVSFSNEANVYEAVDIGQFDRDAELEVVAATDNFVHIMRWNGTDLVEESYSPFSLSSVTGWKVMAQFGDATNDGRNELIISKLTIPAILWVYYQGYEHLSPDNCVLFDNTKTTDNIVFAIEFGEDATVTADDNWDVWVQVYDSSGNEDNRFFLNRFDIVSAAEWNLMETWTGTLEAPVEWQLIEEWASTVEAPVAWNLVESWDGIIGVRAPAEWQLIETWTGTIEAYAEWSLIEQWSGTVQAPSAWQLIETWSGTVEAPVSWQLVETWDGTVEALAQWTLIEQWSGTVQVPSEWGLIETWSGTVESPSAWTLIEQWDGTVSAPVAWELMETWDGIIGVQAPAAWELIETWDGIIGVQAPAEWQLVETWNGTIESPTAWQLIETWSGLLDAPTAWQLISTWSGTVQAPTAWVQIESWSGTINAPVQWDLLETWDGTIESPVVWQLVESWNGTITAPTAWQLIETWTGTIQTPSAWNLMESWSGSIQAPSEWSEVESWTGEIYAIGWTLIETWSGTVRSPAWNLIETWTGTIRTLAVYAVSISITPSENSGTLGDTLTYTVVVVNTGGMIDNYDLTSSDAQGWTTYLDNDNLLNVPSGENRETTLNVGLTTLGTHTVTVTATSEGDGSVSDTDSCTAISLSKYVPPPGGIIGGEFVALGVAVIAMGLVIALVFAVKQRKEED